MPHARVRYLQALIQQSLRHSAAVGILGQRQTGKTTLACALAGAGYITLDDPEHLQAAQLSPKIFLSWAFHPFAIDECQLAPELFPALKLHVQNHPRKGQFLLTGSVRFSARKAIRESLTGRIQILELHPMTLAELNSRPVPDLISEMGLEFGKFQKKVRARARALSLTTAMRYLETGGLPGICFLRDEAGRRPRFSSHLDTILGRDIKMVSETDLSVPRIRVLLATLARQQGQPIALTELSRQARISTPALRKLLHALEALFLIRRVLPMGDIKKESFYLEDQGTASYLQPPVSDSDRMLRLAFSQLYPYLDCHDPGGVMTYRYETRNGACVPLVFESRGVTLGVLPIAEEAADAKALASARSFLRFRRNAHVLILTRGTECIQWSESVRSAPIQGVLG